MIRFTPATLVSVASLTLSTLSFAQGFEHSILYVNTPGAPTNVVPGLGVPFKTGGTGTSAFEMPFISGNGAHWAIQAVANTGATTDDDVYIVNGALFLQEGTQAPWAVAGENVGTLDPQIAINNSGQVLVTNNTAPTIVNDDYVALFTPGPGWSIIAQEAGAIPFLTGVTWDDTLDGAVLTNAGAAGFEADLIDGAITTTTDNILVLGNTIVAQNGVTIPAGQAGGATWFWQNFDALDFYVSPDGLNTLIQGDTDNPTLTDDQVLVYNGTVVLQENSPIAGGPFVEPVDASGIVRGWVDSAGNWYARGNNDVTETDWVVRNGVVVAFADGTDPIVPASTEHWDDAIFTAGFFGFDGNSSGAFVIAGVTDNADPLRNGVIVYDNGGGGRLVAVREGDPVDTDGNGLFDDDRYYNTFGDDDVRLLDDGTIRFVATLKNGAGSAVDQGFFKLRPTMASCTFRNGSGINPAEYECWSLPIMGKTWNTKIATNLDTLATYQIIASAAMPAFPLFGGELLINPANHFIVPGLGGGLQAIAIPNAPALNGGTLATQGLRLDAPGGMPTLKLLNALDIVIRP